MLQESSSSHNIPHVALPSSNNPADLAKCPPGGYPGNMPYSISNSSDLCCAGSAGGSGTPQQPRKKMPAEHFAQLSAAAAASNGAAGVVVVKRHEDSGVGSSGSVATRHQSFDYSVSGKGEFFVMGILCFNDIFLCVK